MVAPSTLLPLIGFSMRFKPPVLLGVKQVGNYTR